MANNKEQLFNAGIYLFFILIVINITFYIVSETLFSKSTISDQIIDNENNKNKDEIPIVFNDTIVNIDSSLYSWKWKDFENKNQQILFMLNNDDIKNATNIREDFKIGIPEIYYKLFNYDKFKLSDLILKMKHNIKSKKLNYLNALNYVCSSIQFIPYTLVLGNEGKCPCKLSFGNFSAFCKVQKDGRGCCSNVLPSGVYSPLEFTYLKTGDCDTRSLFAYTILKQMGFDVAVMISDSQSHSVLGVNLPNTNNYSYGISLSGKKYALWELTTYDWRLGMEVEGDDWIAVLE